MLLHAANATATPLTPSSLSYLDVVRSELVGKLYVDGLSQRLALPHGFAHLGQASDEDGAELGPPEGRDAPVGGEAERLRRGNLLPLVLYSTIHV